MADLLTQRKSTWRNWIVQLSLLLLLGLHSVGLFHHHATADEHNSCVACQVTDHQALDVPDASGAVALAFLVLLFFVSPWHPRAIYSAKRFNRALSRAPPSSL